jgi:hypothetical protein
MKKRDLIRGGIVAAWLLLGALIFVTQRGHTLLVDNHGDEDGGFAASEGIIVVSIDGKGEMEFFPGDRDRFAIKGKKHRITVAFEDGRPDFEGAFTVALRPDTYILSVPKMVAGIEPFMEVFVSAEFSRAPENANEFDVPEVDIPLAP